MGIGGNTSFEEAESRVSMEVVYRNLEDFIKVMSSRTANITNNVVAINIISNILMSSFLLDGCVQRLRTKVTEYQKLLSAIEELGLKHFSGYISDKPG